MQFSTLFLISLFSASIALSGCMGSDNSSAPKKPNQPSSGNNTKPGDKNPGVPNPDPSNPDPSNPGGADGNEDGGTSPFFPPEEDYSNSALTSCDFVQPATSNPAYFLGNTNEESTYNIDDYQQLPVENDNDLSGTWVMINQKSNDLGQFGITQVWEKSFFIIREKDDSSGAFEIASCNTNDFSPITINTENNTLLHADITPMYGSTLFVRTSDTELSEYEPNGLSVDDTALFNKNKAKAIKISSSTASLSNGDNKSTIDERSYENTDVWCVNQARKVTNIQKQSGTCAITDNSQSYLNIAVYGDGFSNRITTVESTEASGGIITGAYKDDLALVIGADSPEDLGVDTSEVANVVLSFDCNEENTNNFGLEFACNVEGLNLTKALTGELSLDITVPVPVSP